MRVGLLLTFLALLPAVSVRAASGPLPPIGAHSVELVGVAANTGGASGGHVALRIGERVYHFQTYNDGLLHLTREGWPQFELRYAVLDNRSLRLTRLDIERQASERIESRLSLRYTTQRAELDRLDALVLERRWREAMMGDPDAVRLRGLGLLARAEHEDPDARRLRASIAERHGTAFLGSEIASVAEEIRASSSQVTVLVSLALPSGEAPPVGAIAAERLRDRLLLREALRALADARPLAEDSLIAPGREQPLEAGDGLAPTERVHLEAFAAALEDTVLRLVSSRRPDRGFPLLLAAARYQAVLRSLSADRLFLLDALPDRALVETGEAMIVEAEELRRHRAALVQVSSEAGRIYRAIRAEAFGAEDLGEPGYNRLEEAASRYLDVREAAHGDRPLRVSVVSPLIPARSGLVRPERIDPDGALQARLLGSARENEARYREALEAVHGYRLLTSNCATEMVASMQSAFSGDDEASRALGGELQPGEALTFIPAALVHQVERRWSVTSSHVQPSRRKQRVSELLAEGQPLWVHLRESNTWSSQAYEGASRDDAFFWFTDGPVLARPLQGVFNLGYGLLNVGLGAVAAPFDGGHRMLAGLRGAFYSVPELVGVNIRKGRYDFPPLPEAPED